MIFPKYRIIFIKHRMVKEIIFSINKRKKVIEFRDGWLRFAYKLNFFKNQF